MFDFKNFKMPTPKSYPGNDIGSRIARSALSTDKNYSNLAEQHSQKPKTGVTTGRNNPRGARGAR